MEDQSARIQSVKAQIQALEMELFRLQQQQAQYETEQRRKQQTTAVPHPNNTSTIVPKNSARYFFIL